MSTVSVRDWSTISPSAKSLLRLRAESGLPYAREAAKLLFGDEAPEPSPAQEARRRHFELRARSVDLALDAIAAHAVLEIASGLSFRGLARAERAGVHYLDTDLPEMAALKADIVARLTVPSRAGTYRIRPLNALDRADFAAAVAELPPGPIAVVVEGLLMYLDPTEKAQLATSIREALAARGGFWITADIYVRAEVAPKRDPRTQAFLDRHKVDENKFASLDAASELFRAHGFRVDRKAGESDPWTARETWVLVPER